MDPESVEESTLRRDEDTGRMVVESTQIFVGEEAIRGRFSEADGGRNADGSYRDSLHSTKRNFSEIGNFTLDYQEPTLPPQAKR